MKLKEPFVMILVGTTLSGKSSWVSDNYPGVEVISRDEIVMELATTRDYTAAFRAVDRKLVEKTLTQRLIGANLAQKSIIIDMTNLTLKRRVRTLSHFSPLFYKVAVVFPILSGEEYQKRNISRNSTQNKWISPAVIDSMIDSYQPPTAEEGFDFISVIRTL